VIVVQCVDFFAEVQALQNQMPRDRGILHAVVILVLRDVQQVTSTAIQWVDCYAREFQAGGGQLMLADVNPGVRDVLHESGAMAALGQENVFPATPPRSAWMHALRPLQGRSRRSQLRRRRLH
jgi:sulfate permease, SulP family